MNTQEPLATFLRENVNLPPYGYLATTSPAELHQIAAQLAGQFLESAEFRALRLGTWLGTAQGEEFTAAVEQVLPPIYRQEAQLVVTALRLAADLQHSEEKRYVGWLLTVALGTVLFGLMFSRSITTPASAAG